MTKMTISRISMAHYNHGELAHLEDIAPRQVLLITGENAHSRYFSDSVFEQIGTPPLAVFIHRHHVGQDYGWRRLI